MLFMRLYNINVPSEINDISTIQEILNGEKNAFRSLYNKYSKLYLLTCLRYVKNRSDAEDLLQDSCIKIFKDLKQFDPSKGTFINWSKRVVINTCLQKLRKNNVLNVFENIIELSSKLATKSEAIENLNLQDLTKLIQKLPKGYRTVFNLYVVDGFSHKEISNLLGISESTSKTQLMKAKRFLKSNISNAENLLVSSYA